ncbi:hypothetical protein [Thioalkalivibrio sp. XN8]|uniref:hypothetical protein n=1 Tax=Thioalkalivibrio sp. XN8 TaxID=2712863 RepID=UPI0013EB40D5|nr:hypothetical protein [Thioalkalivibrio sp. XN8]NGP53413.1 hypothetical protein [Thioalkalivibrio sp. XN8]
MHADLQHLDKLAERAQRYARYSRSAGGLSSVIGGILLFASFLANAYLELGQADRIALALAPALWLLAKELLRVGYYQRDGRALQAPTAKEKRSHRWTVIYLAVISALVLGFLAWKSVEAGRLPGAGMIGYAMIVAALPLVAWRWFWSVSDFLVGVLLMCQSAVVIGGGNYPAIWLAYVGACAAIAVFYGWREHREYLALRAEFAAEGTGE